MAKTFQSKLEQAQCDAELDRELVARAQRLWAGQDAAIAAVERTDDPMSLAAYIERRLSEQEAAAVEAELATDTETREVWLHAREALGSYEAPPSMLLRRVSAMHPDGFTAPVTFMQRWGASLAAARPIDGLAWAAAAALFVMICLGGFELGNYGYASARDEATKSAQLSALPFDPQSMF